MMENTVKSPARTFINAFVHNENLEKKTFIYKNPVNNNYSCNDGSQEESKILKRLNFRDIVQATYDCEKEIGPAEAEAVSVKLAHKAARHIQNRKRSSFNYLRVLHDCFKNVLGGYEFATSAIIAFELSDRLKARALQMSSKPESEIVVSPASVEPKPIGVEEKVFQGIDKEVEKDSNAAEVGSPVVPDLSVISLSINTSPSNDSTSQASVAVTQAPPLKPLAPSAVSTTASGSQIKQLNRLNTAYKGKIPPLQRQGSTLQKIEIYRKSLKNPTVTTSTIQNARLGVFQNIKRFYPEIDLSLIELIRFMTDSEEVNFDHEITHYVIADMFYYGSQELLEQAADFVLKSSYHENLLQKSLEVAIAQYPSSKGKSLFLQKKLLEYYDSHNKEVEEEPYYVKIARTLTSLHNKPLDLKDSNFKTAFKKMISQASIKMLNHYYNILTDHPNPDAELLAIVLETCVNKFDEAKKLAADIIVKVINCANEKNCNFEKPSPQVQMAFFIYNPLREDLELDLKMMHASLIVHFILKKMNSADDMKKCLKTLFYVKNYHVGIFRGALKAVLEKFCKDNSYAPRVVQVMENRKLMIPKQGSFLLSEDHVVAQAIGLHEAIRNKSEFKLNVEVEKHFDTKKPSKLPEIKYNRDNPIQLHKKYKEEMHKPLRDCDEYYKKTIFSQIEKIDAPVVNSALGVIRKVTEEYMIDIKRELDRKVLLDLIQHTNIHVCERLYDWLKDDNLLDRELFSLLIQSFMNKYEEQPINSEVLKSLFLAYANNNWGGSGAGDENGLPVNDLKMIKAVEILLKKYPSDKDMNTIITYLISLKEFDISCKEAWLNVYKAKHSSEQQRHLPVAVKYPIEELLKTSVIIAELDTERFKTLVMQITEDENKPVEPEFVKGLLLEYVKRDWGNSKDCLAVNDPGMIKLVKILLEKFTNNTDVQDIIHYLIRLSSYDDACKKAWLEVYEVKRSKQKRRSIYVPDPVQGILENDSK